MNIDQAKKEAQALSGALRTLGLADISATQSLEAVAKMKGYRNWQTAQAAGNVGSWNVLQSAVYAGYRNNDLLPLSAGQDYVECGDPLFVSLMNVAMSQPLSRLIKTVENWAQEATYLQGQVQQLLTTNAAFSPDSLKLPKGLPPAVQEFLKAEMSEDTHTWPEVGLRLETVRWNLFGSAIALRNLQDNMTADVILLDSVEGTGACIPVRIPREMLLSAAITLADNIVQELKDRENAAPDMLFNYGVNELKVRLAQAGFTPMADTFRGPTWD